MAVVLLRPDRDIWEPGEHNGTFRGNNHAFVTARVALTKFWTTSDFQVEVGRKAVLVTDHLRKTASLLPAAFVKGRGMMQGVDVGSGELAAAIASRCYQNGLIIERSGSRDEVIKVLAPLTTPDEQLLEGLNILEAAAKAESSLEIADALPA
jgi:diaminobutyrate-2-oxoglutarate transaminase